MCFCLLSNSQSRFNRNDSGKKGSKKDWTNHHSGPTVQGYTHCHHMRDTIDCCDRDCGCSRCAAGVPMTRRRGCACFFFGRLPTTNDDSCISNWEISVSLVMATDEDGYKTLPLPRICAKNINGSGDNNEKKDLDGCWRIHPFWLGLPLFPWLLVPGHEPRGLVRNRRGWILVCSRAKTKIYCCCSWRKTAVEAANSRDTTRHCI